MGLHFDAAFYDIDSEFQLEELVSREASWLKEWFGFQPTVFSFHNPTDFLLSCERESYGGLINCYSKSLKSEFSYCSDSNGYWRFRRLNDVLAKGQDRCLQVLTHPGWWQDESMPSRRRIFRSVYGRARETLRLYDEALVNHGRLNQAGAQEVLKVLKGAQPKSYELCDYLWNQGEYQTLFMELWRLHEAQINQLFEILILREWRVYDAEFSEFLDGELLHVDGWILFSAAFEVSWADVSGIKQEVYRSWIQAHNQIVRGRSSPLMSQAEDVCVTLCGLIERVAQWGKAQSIAHDGLAVFVPARLPAEKTLGSDKGNRSEELGDAVTSLSAKRWEQLKHRLHNALDK